VKIIIVTSLSRPRETGGLLRRMNVFVTVALADLHKELEPLGAQAHPAS